MNPTTTLARIRMQRPCNNGWRTLLKSVGRRINTEVSLGDIAKSNGASDAFYCAECLDWSDASVRRAVVGALVPSLLRGATNTDDDRVHQCLNDIKKWLNGDDTVDLMLAQRSAYRAWKEAQAAIENGAKGSALTARAEISGRCADAAEAAHDHTASWAVWAASAASKKERLAQRADLMRTFPPIALA